MRNYPKFRIFFVAGILLSMLSLNAQSGPSINSLNEKMSELERLLGVSGENNPSVVEAPESFPPTSPNFPTPSTQKSSVSDLPESLQGIERKLEELESLVGVLPVEQDISGTKEDPWLEVRDDTNSTVKPEDMPRVEISAGMVVRYVPSNGSFIPLNEGDFIKMKTLIVVPVGSELVVSFIGKSAIRLEENSRLVIGPPENNLQMIDLRKGTISAYLNPERDPLTSPRFGIRTRSGVVEAKGTFYALTVYEGQTYTAVKRGEVKKVPSPPTKLDFAAYVKKSSSKNPIKPAEKNKSN
jgi:hypothetical protein